MTERVLFVKHDDMLTYNSTVRSGSETGPVIAHALETQLSLTDCSKKYQIKHDSFSGRWDMHLVSESPDESPGVISAQRPRWHSRTMLLTMGSETFEMTAKSKLRDQFVVYRLSSSGDAEAEKGAQVVSVEKKLGRGIHTITYTDGAPVELPLFCYWIANMFPRRRWTGAMHSIGL